MKIKRKPQWLRQHLVATAELGGVRRTLEKLGLYTVCTEAKCPNRNRCFASGQATFLIMGDACTRNCRFCAIKSGKPEPLDPTEPQRVAQAARELNLRYVVVTSVTRDDLPDGGAEHFAETIRAIRREVPTARVEVLTPDFGGDKDALDVVFAAAPDVFNHNVETVPRLYPQVRPQADYRRSLEVLSYAKKQGMLTKSGFMVGLGETKDEVFALLKDLRDAGVDIITIGQYLQPSPGHIAVDRFVPPAEFEEYSRFGEEELGFAKVFAGPLVRSSFMAQDIWEKIGQEGSG
ncbi:lipoyl synthase [bacterium]|nr:lipoyl synthase [bacterium]